ncbi:hypothetical protein CDAR_262341 [Caerostris darwini]|uniref:Ribosomal protein L33 n=1 Tax=Caerostris darwini TaxID=1538125 RepID=A0AAV4QEV5_9ARAC|nr:hypothetical protein CDAR_262341 [Caerostris darwini]
MKTMFSLKRVAMKADGLDNKPICLQATSFTIAEIGKPSSTLTKSPKKCQRIRNRIDGPSRLQPKNHYNHLDNSKTITVTV